MYVSLLNLCWSEFWWCCIVCVFGVFFFKQKTAYEMRISDWSSDVCSSDLSQTLTPTRSQSPRKASPGCCIGRSMVSHRYSTELEIGRASCRERVCQYV